MSFKEEELYDKSFEDEDAKMTMLARRYCHNGFPLNLEDKN